MTISLKLWLRLFFNGIRANSCSHMICLYFITIFYFLQILILISMNEIYDNDEKWVFNFFSLILIIQLIITILNVYFVWILLVSRHWEDWLRIERQLGKAGLEKRFSQCHLFIYLIFKMHLGFLLYIQLVIVG